MDNFKICLYIMYAGCCCDVGPSARGSFFSLLFSHLRIRACSKIAISISPASISQSVAIVWVRQGPATAGSARSSWASSRTSGRLNVPICSTRTSNQFSALMSLREASGGCARCRAVSYPGCLGSPPDHPVTDSIGSRSGSALGGVWPLERALDSRKIALSLDLCGA